MWGGVRVRTGPARRNTPGRDRGFSVQFKDKPTQMDAWQGFVCTLAAVGRCAQVEFRSSAGQ